MGKVFIQIGEEFPRLEHMPYLVLVAKTPLSPAQLDLAVRTSRALQAASRSVVKDPTHAAAEIQRQFYAKLNPSVVASAIRTMSPGIGEGGAMTPAAIGELLKFTTESGEALGKPLDPKPGPNAFWTNDVVEAALRGK